MLHYLFTNDMRRKKWPDILVESANLIKNDQVPSATTDKSKNNYINTQQAYLGFYKGSKINEVCSNGDVNAVILNFVNRFQYPNTRTQDSYENAVNDGMCVAPLRLAVQLLFVLNLIDKKEAHISYDELVKYIVCDLNVAKGIKDILSVANQIVLDRKGGIKPLSIPSTEEFAKLGIEWKECPRQIKELFGLLEYVPFITLNEDVFSLAMPPAINPIEAKIFFYIVNNKEMWKIPTGGDWEVVKESYKQYFESGINQFLGLRLENSEDNKSELPPNVDRLSVALKLFAEKRSVDKPGGWSSYDDWTKGVRTEFVAVDEVLLDDSSFDYLAYIRKFGISWQVANTKFAAHSDEEKRAVLKFLKGHNDSPKSASWYIDDANRLVVNGNRVKGMSQKAVLYFMSELHPEEFAAWTEPTYEQLEFLGLHKGAAPSDLTIETYEDCKAKQQLIVAKMKELKIGKASDDPSAPDYRTANEFLWWLGQDDNKNLIKEKVMSKQWKSVNSKDKVKNGTRKLSDALAGNDMLKRLVAALRTKPFAILAGHSGTGKSQLVRRLAYMTCNNELLIKEGEGKTAPGNYCMVQVKPNWHDSTDLLGYYSEMGERHFVNTPFVEFICKAYAYPDTPFFVCLDEMNLAPVEQYFAEYLSAIESMENKDGVWLTDPLVEVDKTGEKDASGKEKVDVEIVDQIMKGAASKEAADWIQAHGLTIPKNLFVVGTVNMDETTCQFSRKVLDRAMTLLMNDVKFSDMGASKKPSDEELLDEAGLNFFLKGEERGTVGAAESALLDGINEPLVNTPFVVAYRFANEYALYEAALAKLNGVDLAAATDEEKMKYAMEALDHVVMMKLLPRIHGELGTVRVLFEGGKRGDKNVPGLESKLPSGGLSVDMMKKILERRDEYLTFWP